MRWCEPSDFRPMGAPLFEVAHEPEVVQAWVVPGADGLLLVHARRGGGNDGGRITLAIRHRLLVDTDRIDPFEDDDGA